ncbi:MAG: hypothetical protein H0V45_11780 [Actinobacteria bacterium]|nr:hypothetical protein [Actinomycetota bacterium]
MRRLDMDVAPVIIGTFVLALGALLFVLRDRLGAQARAQGHGVTPLAYGVVGAILFTFGALYALGGLA